MSRKHEYLTPILRVIPFLKAKHYSTHGIPTLERLWREEDPWPVSLAYSLLSSKPMGYSALEIKVYSA